MAGSPVPAIQASFHMLGIANDAAYGVENCSGPWYQFVYLLWLVGPFTAGMALLGGGLVLFCPNRLGIHDIQCARFAVLMTAAFVGLCAFGPNLQNLRVVSPAAATYCLLAGIGFWYLVSLLRRVLRNDWVVVLLAAGCLGADVVSNYQTFTQVVVDSRMDDLAVRGIRRAMGR